VPVGQCLVLAGQPGAGIPSLETQEDVATSSQSGAALLTNLPQEVLDVLLFFFHTLSPFYTQHVGL